MGKEETTNLIQKNFHPTPLFILTRAFVHITIFYGRNVRNYGPKSPSHHSGSQLGPFELKKVKTSRQYWFHTLTTW